MRAARACHLSLRPRPPIDCGFPGQCTLGPVFASLPAALLWHEADQGHAVPSRLHYVPAKFSLPQVPMTQPKRPDPPPFPRTDRDFFIPGVAGRPPGERSPPGALLLGFSFGPLNHHGAPLESTVQVPLERLGLSVGSWGNAGGCAATRPRRRAMFLSFENRVWGTWLLRTNRQRVLSSTKMGRVLVH